jgi:hypothetical protein
VHRVLYDSDYFEQSNLARNLFKFLKGLSCVLYESDYFEQPVTKKKKDYFEQSNLVRNLYRFLKGLSGSCNGPC